MIMKTRVFSAMDTFVLVITAMVIIEMVIKAADCAGYDTKMKRTVNIK